MGHSLSNRNPLKCTRTPTREISFASDSSARTLRSTQIVTCTLVNKATSCEVVVLRYRKFCIFNKRMETEQQKRQGKMVLKRQITGRYRVVKETFGEKLQYRCVERIMNKRVLSSTIIHYDGMVMLEGG